MFTTLEKEIFSSCGMEPGQRLVVGVSGGADSISLAHVLITLGFEIIITHLNHGIRRVAMAEAKFVEEFARNHSAEFRMEVVNSPLYAKKNRQSLEESARELRYEFLFRTAENAGASAVVVGHTADDQVETILMHFIRGAGMEGLGGMSPRTMTRWSKAIPLVRPMLDIWREEVNAYCEESGLHPLTDESNFDNSFRRNKIRHELIPYLETYNPKLKEIVQRTGKTLRGDFAVLDGLLKETYPGLIMDSSSEHVTIKKGGFTALHAGLKRRILRKAIRQLRPDIRDVVFLPIQRVVEELGSLPKGRKIDLFQGLCLRITDESLNIETWEYTPVNPEAPQLQADLLDIKGEGEFDLGNGWGITVESFPAHQEMVETVLENKDRFTAYFNLEKVGFPLALRVRVPGDRMNPLGMAGNSQKVSDLMINHGLPLHLRARWPILESKGEIIWVAGYQISNSVRVEGNTNKVLKVCIVKIS